MNENITELGCMKMNMGVEHGDPQFRKDVIGRVYHNERAIEAFQIAREAGEREREIGRASCRERV